MAVLFLMCDLFEGKGGFNIELKKRNDSISHVCVVPRSEDEDEAQVEPAQENVAEPQENTENKD